MKPERTCVVLVYVACIDEAVAAEFLEGLLSVDAGRAVEDHIGHCSDCRALVAGLAKAMTGEERDDTVPVATERPRLLRAGDRVARYIILDCLGVGGMGMVYAAYDPKLDRKIALKFIRDRASFGAEATERLVREAQAIAKLSHPNVVAVFDVGTVGEQVYIAMEFVDGCTLTEWLHWSRPWRDVVAEFIAAGRGLEAAHAGGIVHRDFKPDNVMVGRNGRVRVMDFGLARVADGGACSEDEAETAYTSSDSLTRTGAVMGTPRYMAPEQFRGESVGPPADQFSFCAALFQAVYGVHPCRSGTASRLAAGAELSSELLPVPDGIDAPGWLHDVIVRGLAADPGARHSSMETLLDQLSAGIAEPVRRAPPRWLVPVVTVAVALLGWFGVDRLSAEAEARRAAETRESAALDQFESAQGEAELLRQEIDELAGELRDARVCNGRVLELEEQLVARAERLALLQTAPDKRTRTKALASAPRFAEPLDSRLVARRIQARRAAIERCYRRGLRNNPLMAGWIESEFAISAGGKVLWADVRKLRDWDTAECIEAQLARIRFPRSEVGTLATYNFYFAARGRGADLEVSGGETLSGEGDPGLGPLGFRCDPRDPRCGGD